MCVISAISAHATSHTGDYAGFAFASFSGRLLSKLPVSDATHLFHHDLPGT